MSLKKRERRVQAGQRVVKSFSDIPLEQALSLVISAKRAEGLRDRSLEDYSKNYGYFVNWLREKYPEITYVGDVANAMIPRLCSISPLRSRAL